MSEKGTIFERFGEGSIVFIFSGIADRLIGLHRI